MPLRASVLLNRGEVQQKTAPHLCACWYSCAFLLWTLTLPPVAGRQQPVWPPLKEARTISELVAASSTSQLKLQANPLQQILYHGGTGADSRRGIIVAAGGRDMLASTLAVVKVLRVDVECNLPVEVAYHGEDEFDATIVQLLRAVDGVNVRDTAQLPYPQHHYKPDEMHRSLKKILAIYTSELDQILYLDAGSLPLLDPGLMFGWRPFKERGSLFWPDYMGAGLMESPRVELWTEFGLEPPWLQDPAWRSTESGQLLLDRGRHADVLEWLLFLNSHHKVLYGAMQGDRGSFELAFALAGKHSDFRRIKYWPRAALANLSKENHYQDVGILQCDQWGVPSLFHHTAGNEWRLGQDPSEVGQAALFTNGLSTHAREQSAWRDGLGTIALDKAKAVEPGDVTCKHLDLATALLLEEHNRERWGGCRSHMEARQDVPVPLLAWEWLPKSATKTVSAAFNAFKAVRTLLASLEEKAAAAEPKEKEPEQRENTEKEGEEEPGSDDVEEDIRLKILDVSLQERLQSKDVTKYQEGDAKGKDVALEGRDLKDEASKLKDSGKPDSSGARGKDSKDSDSKDMNSAQAADARNMSDDSRRPTAAPGARSKPQLESAVKGDGRLLIPGEADRPRGTEGAELEAASRAEQRRGRRDDGGEAEGQRLGQRDPDGWPDAVLEEEEDTLDDIRQLGGSIGRMHLDQRRSRTAAPNTASNGAGRGSDSLQTKPDSVRWARNKGLETAEGGNTPGDQANMRRINSSKPARSDLKSAQLAKIRSRVKSQRQAVLR